jgi:hypothetical protein
MPGPIPRTPTPSPPTITGKFNATDPDANATITLTFADGNGSQHNNLFTIDANGTLRTTATFDYETNATALHIRVKATDEHNASLAKAFIINVTNVVEDLDGDGIEDHADTDDDGDGFSDATEIAYGSDPRNAASVANQAPSSLDLNGTTIAENQSVGTIVGKLIGIDPDGNVTLAYSRANGQGSKHNNQFFVGPNNNLKTKTLIDFEANASLTVRLKVRDEHNASYEKAFVINVTNIVEDLDQDGIEDHFDPDDDGDGFSDATEIAYGSDPRNNQSVANAPPADLNSTAYLAIAENQPAGTIVGKFNATDSDANATLTFTLVGGTNDNHLFTIDANGTLRTVAVFDYETNATFTIRAKVRDQYNMYIKKNFSVTVTNIVEDLDQDGIEDHFDPDDDGDGFTDVAEIAYGSDPRDPTSRVNSAPTDITLNHSRIAEGRPAGELVGVIQVSDPDDENGTGNYLYALADGNGSSSNALFSLDTNGTLRTAAILDHEANATETIRVRVTDEWNASLEKSFSIEVIDLPEQEAPPPTSPPISLPSWLAGSQPAGSDAPDWYQSPWFGGFHITNTPWLYHSQLGWLYALDDGNGNAWLWTEAHGWLWTGQGLFRYLYRHGDHTWIYFIKRENGSPRFYNHATKRVE